MESVLVRSWIGLGSNKGDRRQRILDAVRELREAGAILVALSSLYRTEPVGAPGPWYLNAAAGFDVPWNPLQLLQRCEEIESRLGRESKADLAPRTIDIDILLYDDLCLDAERLVLPHRGLPARRFVLVPLAEIAPDLEVPGLGATVRMLLESCPDDSSVEVWSP